MQAPRMRTIDQCVNYFHEQDPDTAMTRTALTRYIESSNVPTVQSGNKKLVNLDALIQCISPEGGKEDDVRFRAITSMFDQIVEHNAIAQGLINQIQDMLKEGQDDIQRRSMD